MKNITSDLEQFETTCANIALILVSYYKELVDNGVPEILAAGLIVEFQNIWLSSIFNYRKD